MSIYLNPSTWRLTTAGGIKYKLFEDTPTGSFTRDAAGIQEKIIIQASDFDAFLNESFPDSILYPQDVYESPDPRVCPHHDKLFTKKVDLELFPKTLPGDPFGVDSGAPDKTHSEFLLLTIDYEPLPSGGKDWPSEGGQIDYGTVEISSELGGQFMMVPCSEKVNFGTSPGDMQPAKSPTVKIPLVIPLTQWNVHYPRITRDIVIAKYPTIRSCLGHVNSGVIPLFMSAAAETVIFMGCSLKATKTWKDTAKTPMEATLKFSEKHVVADDGTVKGWNHEYNPETGSWQKAFLNGNPVYKLDTLTSVFF